MGVQLSAVGAILISTFWLLVAVAPLLSVNATKGLGLVLAINISQFVFPARFAFQNVLAHRYLPHSYILPCVSIFMAAAELLYPRQGSARMNAPVEESFVI